MVFSRQSGLLSPAAAFRLGVAAIAVVVILALPLLYAPPARATADGPEFYRVVDVSPGSALNLRLGPGIRNARIGRIPAGSDGLVNFGCEGGLSLMEWQKASEAEREASRFDRWCLIGYDSEIGWVSGRYLVEGAGPSAFRGGRRLTGLAGSEWAVVRLGDQTISNDSEAFIQFRADAVGGLAFCNSFQGPYGYEPGRLSIGPLMTTRMACAGDLGKLEQGLHAAFSTSRDALATHLVLGLFDLEGRLLVTLRRRDPD